MLGGFVNVSKYLSCEEDVSKDDFEVSTFSTFDSYCMASAGLDQEEVIMVEQCPVNNYPGIETCMVEQGSKTLTFWSYFALRMIFQCTMSSVYSLMDATALKLAKKHDSDFAYIFFWQMVAVATSPIAAEFLIREGKPGSGGKFSGLPLCDWGRQKILTKNA